MAEEQKENVPFLSREEIERRAKSVLRDHGLTSVPIDPVVLAKRQGIKVFNAKFSDDNLVGMIARRGENVTILVNQSDSPGRKRFTIAHELGHHFLHLMKDGEYVDGEKNLFRQPKDERENYITPESRREYQANMFAAALLMPEEEVREAAKVTDSVKDLARLFNVSEAALGIRLNQLGLLDEQTAGTA